MSRATSVSVSLRAACCCRSSAAASWSPRASSASASRATRPVTKTSANAIENTATAALARKTRLRSDARKLMRELI